MTQGTTKGVPIDTDGTLVANSDALVASQKATKTYADAKVSTAAFASSWDGVGGIAPSKNAVYDAFVGPSPNEAFIAQYADRTLTSTTSLQKLFNATTNGAYTVDSDTAYWFECQFVMSTMGSTSGNLQFDVLGAGTATIYSTAWSAYGRDAGAYNNPGTTAGCFTESKVSTGDIVSAGTGSGMFAKIEGILRITTGGTIIPSVALTNAAAATLKANSYFKIRKIGAAAVTSAGAWS